MDSPSEVVTRQVAAFNAADLEAFLDTYADDAAVHGVPGGPLLGRAALRAAYAERLPGGGLHCEILASHEFGRHWVAVHERVTGPEGAVELVAVFDVSDGRIRRADMSARYPAAAP